MKKLLVLAIVGLLLGVISNAVQPFILSILSNILIFSIAATGLNLLSGYTGQMSLGHAAFMAIGAYSSAFLSLKFGTPIFLNMIVGAVIAGFMGLLIGLPSLRLKGFYLAIATLAFGVGVKELIGGVDFLGGQAGLYGIPKIYGFNLYLLSLGIFLLAYGGALVISKSPYGLMFRMVRDSEVAAENYGIRLPKVKLNAFIVSAVYGSVAGALYAHKIGFLSPDNLSLDLSINLVVMIIIGGMASLEGGLIGAAVVSGLPFLFSRSPIPMSIIFGSILIVFVLFFPQGILYGILVGNSKYFQRPFIALRKLFYRHRNPDGSSVIVRGKKIFYAEKGEGPVILYIHGNTASHLWWSEVMDVPGYRCIAPDLPNFGHSSHIASSDPAEYAEFIALFMDELKIESGIIVAQSLGGAVAYPLAFKYPEKVEKLFLLDACPIDGLITPEEHFPVIERYKTDLNIFRRALASILGDRGEDRKLVTSLLNEAILMNPASYLGHPRELAKVDYREEAAGFGKPAVFVVGKEDPVISEEHAVESMRYLGGAVIVIEGIGHCLNLEDPAYFKKLVKDFADGSDTKTTNI